MIGNDGMPGISQEPVKPGGRFVYEFDIHQSGTYFYHSHMAMQEMAGMLGGFIMHPRTPYRPHCDKDFLLHLQEYAILPNNNRAQHHEHGIQLAAAEWESGAGIHSADRSPGRQGTHSLCEPGHGSSPLAYSRIHVPGHGHRGGPHSGDRLVARNHCPGRRSPGADIEITADRIGDWMLHCHLPHHMMNQMSSNVGSMTRRPGQPAGVDMNTGMGMLQGTPGAPTGDDYGTSLGRGMGFGSTADMATANGPLGQKKAMGSMPGMADMAIDVRCQRKLGARLPPGCLHGRPLHGHGPDGR